MKIEEYGKGNSKTIVMLHGAYFGTMMVHLGRVDGMVSGAAHTTANTIRPALEFIRTKEGVDIVSSVFLMLLEDRVLVYGDCAVSCGGHYLTERFCSHVTCGKYAIYACFSGFVGNYIAR
jgi:phosphotransacetylase